MNGKTGNQKKKDKSHVTESRKLDDWITSYLEFTSNDEPRETFRKFVAISTIAACLRRKCSLNWEKVIYPNLYIVLVGPPASRKNTAIEPAESLLREIGVRVSAQATTREALIKDLGDANKLIVPSEDALLTPSDAAMTIISTEFTVFLGIKNLQLIGVLCDWYDCQQHWTYRTKNMGTDSIENVWVNLLAGTTPTALKDSLPRESIGMGLTSRVIFVCEENKAKPIYFTPNVDVYDEKLGKAVKLNPDQYNKWDYIRGDLVHDLNAVSMLQGTFIPSMEYHSAYVEWRKSYEDSAHFQGTLLENYANRAQTHVRKLSMIYSASRSDDMMLTLKDFNRAAEALNQIEKKMNLAFSGIGKSDIADITHDIMQLIAHRKVVTQRELQKAFWQDADKTTLARIIETCEGMGFCKREFKGNEVQIIYLEEKKT